MALIVSSASGNFNAGATWVGGVVPGVGDEAQAANGHTITITANVTCDEVSNAGFGFFEINPNVTLTANVTSKSTNTANRVVRFNFAAPNTANIVGIVTGGLGSNQTFAVQNSSTGTLNVTGDCIGGSGSNTIAAANSSTGVLNLTGSCTGSSAPAASNSSTGVLNITGNCIGGTSASAFGANNASTGTMLINGTIQASEFTGGVGGTNRQQVTLLTGPFLISPTFGVNPIANVAWRWASALNDQTYLEVGTQTLLQKRNLVTPDNATNFPTASDVRSGTAYGIGGVLSGTCVVPNPAQVAAGTPVDNTVGTLSGSAPTAAEVASAVWSSATSSITTAGSIGERLKNASTVATNGEQLASALTAPL